MEKKLVLNNLIYYFSIGTNIGDRIKNLNYSIEYLKKYIEIISLSSVYKTKPLDMKSGTDFFYNMIIKGKSTMRPENMLAVIEGIEKTMGRKKKHNKNQLYEDRIIDLDILLAGDLIINSEKLIIPHKEMLNRTFVLVPLIELSPNLFHPVNNQLIASHLDLIKNKNEVTRVDCIKI